MQATLRITDADRDAQGKIIVEPRSLADLLPTHEAIKADAQRVPRVWARREIAGLSTVSLVAAFIIVAFWGTPAEPVSRATAVPTAYVALPTRVPTLMPTSVPTVVPTTQPAAAPTLPPPPPPTQVVIVEQVVVERQVVVTAVPAPAEEPQLQEITLQAGDEPLTDAQLREAMDQ
jgi:hypothetical protein